MRHPVPGAADMLGASPGPTIPADIPPFRFQPRQIRADWRGLSAVDVERVAREVDVATLQQHLAGVTFCDLDGERCPHCGQPVDPVLLKVLRMAQLSIEYLLHCQDRLGTSLAAHVQRLQAAHTELERTQQQAVEQATQLQGAKEESRRWKKLVATQYLLLQAGPDAYCKCHLCDKAFVNNSFLQAHVQRRHAEATKAERQKAKQVEQMEDEVEELKAKLRETQQRLEAEREAEKLRRKQEVERARQREEEGRRDLERWKEEERTKLREEVDGLRQLFLAAFKDVASRNSAMEGKLQELRAREMALSNLGSLRDDDTEEAWGRTPSWAERERMAVQLTKEKKTLCAAPSQEVVMDRVHQRSTQLGEQPKVVKSQEKEIKLLSASKPEVTQEVTKVVAGEESSAQSLKSLGSLRGSQSMVVPATTEPKSSVIPQPAPRTTARSTHSPLRTPWGTLWTSKVSSPHGGLVPRWSSDAALGGKQPTVSPVNLSPQQEPVVWGDETVSDGSDQDSLEEMAGSGTATSTMVRLLERRLDAVAQRQLGGVKLFPALSSASSKTSQPTKKLQFAGDSDDLDTSSLEDLDEPPALVAADPRKTTSVPRPLGCRAARGHMVVTGK